MQRVGVSLLPFPLFYLISGVGGRYCILCRPRSSHTDRARLYHDRTGSKTALSKPAEELHVMQVLASASRRRVTKSSTPTQSPPAALHKTPKPTGRRWAESDASTPFSRHAWLVTL